MKAAIKKHDPAKEYYFQERCFITEISNTADDPDVSIARARLGPGVTTRWHKLLDTAERYVIIAGEGRVEIGSVPARRVTTGDVVLIPAGCRQRISNTGSEDLLFLAICTPRFSSEAYVDMEGGRAACP